MLYNILLTSSKKVIVYKTDTAEAKQTLTGKHVGKTELMNIQQIETALKAC